MSIRLDSTANHSLSADCARNNFTCLFRASLLLRERTAQEVCWQWIPLNPKQHTASPWGSNPRFAYSLTHRRIEYRTQFMLQPRGVLPPEAMMHFPPCFRFSPTYFLKNFRLEIFLNFWWPFFSHRPQISNFPPIFPVSVHFPPYFAKIIISPLLLQISFPVVEKFTCFLHTLCVFGFPPTLTMMHLCITQCTYWTPLLQPTWSTALSTINNSNS